VVKKRGKTYHLYFRPFGQKLVGIKTPARTKTEAKQIEAMILRACRTGDYSVLDSTAREACIRMFQNQHWELPPDLVGGLSKPTEELTLWKAWSLFLKYPEIRVSKARERYEAAIIHLVQHFGKEQPIKSIWVPDLKAYQSERLSKGASPATVNRELGTLSKLFGILIELQIVDTNPVRLVKRLSEKSGERQVYMSFKDVQLIMDKCPVWYRPVIAAAYYTGARRGEILGLTRKQVNLSRRMIFLGPEDTKEGQWKRIPIHRKLVPYLEEALKLTSLVSDKVFLLRDEKGIKPLGKETVKNPWPRACKALEKAELLTKPFPHFHDLRHTWKTNARRSGMDPEIRESILGHWFREKSVSERYGRISNEELSRAIDSMTFDHGETEIFVARRAIGKQPEKNVNKALTKPMYKEKSGRRLSSITP